MGSKLRPGSGNGGGSGDEDDDNDTDTKLYGAERMVDSSPSGGEVGDVHLAVTTKKGHQGDVDAASQ